MRIDDEVSRKSRPSRHEPAWNKEALGPPPLKQIAPSPGTPSKLGSTHPQPPPAVAEGAAGASPLPASRYLNIRFGNPTDFDFLYPHSPTRRNALSLSLSLSLSISLALALLLICSVSLHIGLMIKLLLATYARPQGPERASDLFIIQFSNGTRG